MQIATWNVNSVRARLPRLLAWLEEHSPDIVCLQELKCIDEQFPAEPIEDLGYNIETFGQKTYNGVAILSKDPIEDPIKGLPDDDPRAGARVLGCFTGGVQVLNLYVINGRQVGHEYFDLKLRWMGQVCELIEARFDLDELFVCTGDFNVTFDDRDVYDPEGWREKIHCSTPEREALAKFTDLGLTDAFRQFEEDAGHYTWWDFRTRGFDRGAGLRIDHFLVSEAVTECAVDCHVDLDARGGEKPSDHAPLVLTLD